MNALNCIDVYKVGHKDQYPDKTEFIYSNFTPRSSRLFTGSKLYDNKVVVFGIQTLIIDYLINEWNNSFFNKPRDLVIERYKRRIKGITGVEIDTSHIGALHDLGYLPIRIKALEEGTRSPIKIPVLTITNTNSKFFWLVNYLETVISTELWKPMTTATIAFEYRRIFEYYSILTGSSKDFIKFQGHDFSARGLSNREDGYKSGIGHLLSFYGTDTVRAIDGAEDFYDANVETEIVGVSVFATEHSVMSLGSKESEIDTFRRLINEIYPIGIVSIVSDTWDFWKVISEYTLELKDEILARNGKVVFRPDSGNPVDIICGDENASGCIKKGAIETLWDIFGGTVNEKGFKTLNQKVGLIYGDSITLQRQEEILEKLMQKGFASDNVVLGIGSYSYQYNTRDTLGFAMKATYGVVDGEAREIFKNPKTDNGIKKSARGLLQVEKINGDLMLKDQCTFGEELSGELKTVFLNGKLINNITLKEIRKLIDMSILESFNKTLS